MILMEKNMIILFWIDFILEYKFENFFCCINYKIKKFNLVPVFLSNIFITIIVFKNAYFLYNFIT